MAKRKETKNQYWFNELLRACRITRDEILSFQRGLVKRDSDVVGFVQRSRLEYLETTLIEGIDSPNREVRELALTLYPEYRNALHELNKGERQDIYARYHGYCQESPEAMSLLQPRVKTSHHIKLLPIVPNAVRELPLNLKPVVA